MEWGSWAKITASPQKKLCAYEKMRDRADLAIKSLRLSSKPWSLPAIF